MIYYLPVLLMCLADGCKFYADPPQAKFEECKTRIERISGKLNDSEVVKAYQATCIEIKLGRDT